MLKRAILIILKIVFLSSCYLQVSAKEIPVIVIAPSKKSQSLSTVGTSVTILDEKFFENTNQLFLGDILSSNSTSTNFFQSGGHGTSSAIQLRGLPKRYSTVYIDGVKMSDPSSVSNDFDFNHILSSQISTVEILKGNQSSIYGSGAIGGTINIFTKKPKEGFHKDFKYNTGSNGTHNLATSLSGGTNKKKYYFGFERFHTDGISTMVHNNEKDRYRNNSIYAKYDYGFSKKLKLESNLRFVDTYLQYDKEINTSTATHDEEVDATEASYNVSAFYHPTSKLSNKLTFANSYIKRVYAATENSGNPNQDNYYGSRYNLSYTGSYNFNLDKSLVFGIEREDDKIGYNKDLSGRKDKHNYINSKFFDIQSRVTKNLYFTFGSRFDEHSLAGNEDSHRITSAYIFDDKTLKFKSSIGTGFRYPSLYEMFFVYAANSDSLKFVKAENSRSYDFGVEKFFPNYKLKIDATYFNLKYDDTLEGWKSGDSSGSAYTTQNMPGTVKSQGLEFISKFTLNDYVDFELNYTYTSTYDGAEQDDPDKSASYTNSQIVRVPRNLINLKTYFKFPYLKKLNFTLNTRWSDEARDYGNGNRTYDDERIDDYLVNDLHIDYKLLGEYQTYLKIINLFDEKYETARDYSQHGRSINFGIKQKY